MENLMTSQRLTKGLNELVDILITFMASIWKTSDLNQSFPGVLKKNSPQTSYDSYLVNL